MPEFNPVNNLLALIGFSTAIWQVLQLVLYYVVTHYILLPVVQIWRDKGVTREQKKALYLSGAVVTLISFKLFVLIGCAAYLYKVFAK